MKQIFFIGLVIFLVMVVLAYIFQRHLIYFPAKNIPLRSIYHAEDMQEIHIPTSDGLNLLAWYKPAIDNHSTILYFHGNAGHIGYRMPLVRHLISEGFGVLLLEYRGYGGNPGSPSETGMYLDAEAAMRFLQAQGVLNTKVVLYGESLGTGVATHLASQTSVCAVILQSPYTSLPALAKMHYPWILLKPWDKFDSFSRIKKINAPLFILQGKEDSIVPYQQAVTLYEQANQPKMWKEYPNQGHNDLWNPEFYEQILQFISRVCK